MIRARLEDLVRLERAGYEVERWGTHGWVLRDPDGYPLLIGEHGCVAPRQADAVAEGLERIASSSCPARHGTER